MTGFLFGFSFTIYRTTGFDPVKEAKCPKLDTPIAQGVRLLVANVTRLPRVTKTSCLGELGKYTGDETSVLLGD